MDNEGIDDILNGTGDEPVIEQPETEEAPATAERPRGPDGKFIPKDTGETPQEASAAEAAPPAADLPTVPVRALEDERRKRQELERRLAQMEQALAQPRQPQQPAPPVDFWEDPNSFLDGRLNEFGQTLIQQWEHRQQVNRVNQSEAAAKAKYPDFEEVAQEFVKQVQINPSLVQAMAAAENPGEFVYQRGKQALELAQVGDLEAYKAKVIAEYEEKLKASLPPTITAPTTTAGMRSLAGRAAPEWAGPSPIGDILK